MSEMSCPIAHRAATAALTQDLYSHDRNPWWRIVMLRTNTEATFYKSQWKSRAKAIFAEDFLPNAYPVAS